MTTILEQSAGTILDNVADCIEGGNSYRGSGTAYRGIAGTQSHDQYAGTTITEDTGGSTTAIDQDDVLDDHANLVRSDTPPMFLLCATATDSRNVGAARKISAYNPTTGAITVAAFPQNNTAADTFIIREGFKRIRDGIDIEGEDGIADGFDRQFHVAALPGTRLEWYGNGIETYETELVVRLRMLSHSRLQTATASAIENLLFFRHVLTKPSHRDGTYIQLIDAIGTAPSVITSDANKVVVSDSYRLIYRVSVDWR